MRFCLLFFSLFVLAKAKKANKKKESKKDSDHKKKDSASTLNGAVAGDWLIAKANRAIQLEAGSVISELKFTIKNIGKNPQETFYIPVQNRYSRLGHVMAFEKSAKEGLLTAEVLRQNPKTDKKLALAKTDDSSSDEVAKAYIDVDVSKETYFSTAEVKLLQITLPREIKPTDTYSFTVMLYFGKAYEPLPKKIHIFQTQWLLFREAKYILSPYTIETQTTTLELPLLMDGKLAAIESFSPYDAVGKNGRYTMGPYTWNDGGKKGWMQNLSVENSETTKWLNTLLDETPLNGKREMIRVHFNHADHQAYFEKVKRQIEVSHWGNLLFTENYRLTHGGASLTGEFFRIPFTWDEFRNRGMQTPPNPVKTHMPELTAVLPRTARNIQYKDEIGNISSSNARRDDRGYVLAQLRPRYPLLGGWNADWDFTYDVPTKSALKTDPNDPTLHVLNITMSPPIVRTFSEKLTVEVLLPEGAYDIDLRTPKNWNRMYTANKDSWIDFHGGRPVVGFEIEDFLVPEKIMLQYKFQVIYRFSNSRMILEPLIMAVILFLALALYIFSGRVEMRITRRGEGEQLDRQDFDQTIIKRAMDSFDAVVNSCEVLFRQAEEQCLKPVRHKWDSILKGGAADVEAKHKAFEELLDNYSNKPQLEKLRTNVKAYVEFSLKTITKRGDGIFIGLDKDGKKYDNSGSNPPSRETSKDVSSGKGKKSADKSDKKLEKYNNKSDKADDADEARLESMELNISALLRSLASEA